MSLFKWSTPERRSRDRILPIIPNEIYLHVLDYVAPSTGPLATEELETFTNLSGVCRFFANVCLPRIFEFVEFSGSIFPADTAAHSSASVYKTPRGSTLCSQIAAKQPIALILAKTVKACRFSDWTLDQTGSWAVRLFAKKYIDGMLHMVNIRELEFFQSFVDTEHWNAIATLHSLEELSFDRCIFLGGPADVAPGKWVKIKVTRLRLIDCEGDRQPIAAIDLCYLRTVTTDFKFLIQADFLAQSPLTELHFRSPLVPSGPLYVARLAVLLELAPRSLELLYLYIYVAPPSVLQDIVGSIFNQPQWKNFPLLRSLTVWVPVNPSLGRIISSALENICHLTNLQSFALTGGRATMIITPMELHRIVQEKLGSDCSLKHVVIYDVTFHLVDGEWRRVAGPEVISWSSPADMQTPQNLCNL